MMVSPVLTDHDRPDDQHKNKKSTKQYIYPCHSSSLFSDVATTYKITVNNRPNIKILTLNLAAVRNWLMTMAAKVTLAMPYKAVDNPLRWAGLSSIISKSNVAYPRSSVNSAFHSVQKASLGVLAQAGIQKDLARKANFAPVSGN